MSIISGGNPVTVPSGSVIKIGTDTDYLGTWNRLLRLEDDWVSGSVAGRLGWINTVSGSATTATQITAGQDVNHPGILTIPNGTTAATGRSAISLSPNAAPTIVITSANEVMHEWLVYITTLSNVTDTFGIAIGFGDTLSAMAQANGVYFSYDQANSTFWRINTAASSVRTTTDTSVTVTAAQWYHLKAIKASGSTTWTFYIDGVSVGTISTNVPTAAVGPLIVNAKSAGSTSRDVRVDAFRSYIAFDSVRAS